MKDALSDIPTIYTFVTPIRSVAFSNHCVWVEQIKKNLAAGEECAIYYEPYPNRVYPATLDAIMIEISVQVTGYKVAGFAVIPDQERRELHLDQWHANFEDAKLAATNWLLSVGNFIDMD